MPDTDLNLTVDVTGNTASIATDYSTNGVTNGHVQIVKLAFQESTNTGTNTRVTTSKPLPVDIRAATATIGITGSVSGLGNFRVLNGLSGATLQALFVVGTTGGYPVNISGYIQGISTGVPVGVTGTVIVRDNLRIQGLTSGYPVAITGGRPLSSATDSITVSGTVGVSGGRYLSQTTDFVRIFGGNAGETMIPVVLRSTSGSVIGVSGDALNVNIVGTGITATVSVATLIGVCQATPGVPFYIAGATTGPGVRVKGTLGAQEAVEVGWSSTQNVAIVGAVQVDNTALVQKVQDLRDVELQTLISNTDNIGLIYNSINNSAVNTKVTSITRPSSVYTGTVGLTGTSYYTIPAKQLFTGVTVKAGNNGSTDILIKGNGSNTTYPLSSGEVLFIETNNLSNLSFSAPSGSATFHYIAS